MSTAVLSVSKSPRKMESASIYSVGTGDRRSVRGPENSCDEGQSFECDEVVVVIS